MDRHCCKKMMECLTVGVVLVIPASGSPEIGLAKPGRGDTESYFTHQVADLVVRVGDESVFASGCSETR